MQLEELFLPRITKMRGYVPGEQPTRPDIIKLNTNENPFPISDVVRQAIQSELDSNLLQKYPNPRSQMLRDALAGFHKKTPAHILAGNGSDDILAIVFRALLERGRGVVCPDPAYGLYPTLAEIVGCDIYQVPVTEDWQVDFGALLARATDAKKTPLAIITNPNAPTGIAAGRAELLDFARTFSGITLVDEAYVEFGGESLSGQAGSAEYPRLMTCNTMSKAYSLAGMRLGWLVAHPDLITQFDKVRDSYNLSRFAQAAGVAALADRVEIERRVQEIIALREWLTGQLATLGFATLPSRANFIFSRPPQGTGKDLFEHFERDGIIVRHFDSPRLRDFVRITIGTRAQMERVVESVRSFLK